MSEEPEWDSELCIEYNTWCAQHGYRPQSADELLYDLQLQLGELMKEGTSVATDQTPSRLQEHITWLEDFCERWHAAEDGEIGR